jgi:hypothetical protein
LIKNEILNLVNNGYRNVHNCQAELSIIIPEADNPMLYPSDETKLLAWGRFPQSDDIENKRTIRGHGKELLHIAFSDSLFKDVKTSKEEEKQFAGISTVENLKSVPVRQNTQKVKLWQGTVGRRKTQ